MGRPATGRVDQRTTTAGETVYSIRVPCQGRRPRITLGSDTDGWSRERAEQTLADTIAALRIGVALDTLFPSEPVALAAAEHRGAGEPTIAELVAAYLANRDGQVATRTLDADRWALEGHIAPALGHLTPSQVDVDVVDAFRRAKLAERERIRARAAAGAPEMERREYVRDDGRRIAWEQRRRPLSDAQINRLVDQLATLLDVAIERPDVQLAYNPARGRRRKIKVAQPTARTYLEPDQVWALLDAAHALEVEARKTTGARALPRRAIIATLVMGGERISELCDTRRANLNLGARILRAGGKTAAGMNRSIDLIFDVLIDILSDHVASLDDPSGYLFPAHGGTRLAPDNVRRMLAETAARADELARDRGIAPPGHVTPHMCRRTNISLLAAAGYDPSWIMAQVGHTDPKLTLRIYTQVLKHKRSAEYRDRANDLLGAATAPVRTPSTTEDTWASSSSTADPARSTAR